MKPLIPLTFLLLGSSLGLASTLSVYQDKTRYTYTSNRTYLGMTKNIAAKCDGERMETLSLLHCPKHERLCNLSTGVGNAEIEVSKIQQTGETLEKLLTLAQPDKIDATAWIEAAERIGETKAVLQSKAKIANAELKMKSKQYNRQAPSRQALLSGKVCASELELTLPYGYVSFSTMYEAEFKNDKEVKVTQKLSILNRSGIDIKADKATFYHRAASQHLHVINFDPWIVSKYEPHPKRRMLQKSVMSDAAMNGEVEMMSVAAAVPPRGKMKASYVDAREYSISNLVLPSSGVAVDVDLVSWVAPANCTLKAYPYLNTHAFTVCSFTPKHQIETDRWKIKAGKVTINDKAVGQYNNGKYDLYTKKDEDIKIVRRPIVKNERETGIFGTTVRKKDGYVLTLTNKSDKEKKLMLIDRIPTSTNEAIRVKLLKVRSKEKIDYTLGKEGKVALNLHFAAKESKKIEILFEISYDKELKVRY